MNEDLPWGYECTQIMQQPGGLVWGIWDDKWKPEVVKMNSQCCKNMTRTGRLWRDEMLQKGLDSGEVISAQTIDELVKKMDLPETETKAAIARYNELAKLGKDLDFGKHPDRLTTIEKAPFYAAMMKSRFLVILSGLKIITRCRY